MDIRCLNSQISIGGLTMTVLVMELALFTVISVATRYTYVILIIYFPNFKYWSNFSYCAVLK